MLFCACGQKYSQPNKKTTFHLYVPINEERLTSSTKVSSRVACRMGTGAEPEVSHKA